MPPGTAPRSSRPCDWRAWPRNGPDASRTRRGFFSRAVDIVETRRASFDVDSRQRILSGKTIIAYWGLLRAHAALYSATRNPLHFQGALRAARMLRARQFGDLLGIDRPGGTDLVIGDLRLQPDELLVNMVTTDEALVVFAISRDRTDVLLRPMDMADLRRGLGRPARRNPGKQGHRQGPAPTGRPCPTACSGPCWSAWGLTGA